MLGSPCSPCCGSGCDSCPSGTVPQSLSATFTLAIGSSSKTISLSLINDTGNVGFLVSPVCHAYSASWGTPNQYGFQAGTAYYNDVDSYITFTSQWGQAITAKFSGIITLIFRPSSAASANQFVFYSRGDGGFQYDPNNPVQWWRVDEDLNVAAPGTVSSGSLGSYETGSLYFGSAYASASNPCYADFGSLTLPVRVNNGIAYETTPSNLTTITLTITGATP